MSKKENENDTQKKSILIKVITGLLILLALLFVYVIVFYKSTALYVGLAGIILLIVLMNIADKVIITKDNIKTWSIISVVLSIISIPLLLKYVILSFDFVVPAFILSKKAMKKDSRPPLTKMSFFVSTIVLFACLAFSVIGALSGVKSV